MRVLEWIFLACDAALFVLATLLVFAPEARSPMTVHGLHVLVVLVFTSIVLRLHRAKALSTPITKMHRSLSIPRPSFLQVAASVMGAIAITMTAG
jgi:hypothetical protein